MMKQTHPQAPGKSSSSCESCREATCVVGTKKLLTHPASIGYKSSALRGVKNLAERQKNWLNNRGIGKEVVRVQGATQKDNERPWFSHGASQHEHEDKKTRRSYSENFNRLLAILRKEGVQTVSEPVISVWCRSAVRAEAVSCPETGTRATDRSGIISRRRGISRKFSTHSIRKGVM